jgi:hypothetical protein
MPLTDRFEIIRAEVRNCGTFTTLNSSYFPHIAIFVPQRLGCSKNRPPVRADTLNAALRTFSRGFVLWRFSYAGPRVLSTFRDGPGLRTRRKGLTAQARAEQ